MKCVFRSSMLAVKCAVALVAISGFVWQSSAQTTNTLRSGLIAFWPMQTISGDFTPDVVGGYNMLLSGKNGGLPTITNNAGSPASRLNGESANAIYLNAADNEELYYLAGTNDLLPINKQNQFTVAMWINANVTNNAQNTYIFTEDSASGGIYPQSQAPVWAFGMDAGATTTFGQWLTRNYSGTSPGYGVGVGGYDEAPAYSEQGDTEGTYPVFDGDWHLWVTTLDTNGNYETYVDGSGIQDPGGAFFTDSYGNPTALQPKPLTNTYTATNTATGNPWNVDYPAWTWDVDVTSIGGLSRSGFPPGADNVTGMVDNLAMWNRPLGTNEIKILFAQGIPQIGNGVIAYWPMQTINGNNTPDIVGGYNMLLSGKNGGMPTITNAAGSPASRLNGESNNAIYLNAADDEELYYLAGVNDALPVNKQNQFTVAMWINANVTNNAQNTYIFTEDSASGGIYPQSQAPVWAFGMDAGATTTFGQWLTRNYSGTSPGYGVGVGGYDEAPAYSEQGDTEGTYPVFDGDWHLWVTTLDTNGNYETYVDGSGIQDPGGAFFTDSYGNPTALQPKPLTNTYTATNTATGNPWNVDYPAWTWDVDVTSIGGLSRSGFPPGADNVTGMVDNLAMWNRPLGTNEIKYLYLNGVPQVASGSAPLKLTSFTADYTEAAQGDTVTLRWGTANATDISISPTPGDVFADTAFGAGSVAVTVTSNTTFTITAKQGATKPLTASVTVTVLPGVAAGWHLVQRFDDVPPTYPNAGGVGNGVVADNWENSTSDPEFGLIGVFNTVTEGTIPPATNNVLGYVPNNYADGTDTGCLSAQELNSYTVAVGESNTLFFRFYIADTNVDDSDIWLKLGFSDQILHQVSEWYGDSAGANDGCWALFTRLNGGIVDMQAPNGVASYNEGLTTAPYSQVVTNTGLQPATVYDVWMDVQCSPWSFPTNSDGTTNQLGDIFSVYIKPDSAASPPIEVWTNQYSDRDDVNPEAATGGLPRTNLSEVFFVVAQAGEPNGNYDLGTNTVVIDDLYISKSGYNHTVPIPASYFPPPSQPGTSPITINTGQSFYLGADPKNNNQPDFTLTWSSSVADYPNITYSVLRSTNLADTNATLVLTRGIPSGGSSGAAAPLTTFTDTNPPPIDAFYWITSP